MGSAFDHLSREELLALLGAQAEPSRHLRPPGIDLIEPPASGDRYREIVEQASDGIFISDEAGRYLDVNEAGARMLRTTREELVGKHITDVLNAAERDALVEQRAKVAAGEWVLREWQLQRADGTTFTGEISSKRRCSCIKSS